MFLQIHTQKALQWKDYLETYLDVPERSEITQSTNDTHLFSFSVLTEKRGVVLISFGKRGRFYVTDQSGILIEKPQRYYRIVNWFDYHVPRYINKSLILKPC